jgi:hypothetical protein
MHRCLLEKLLFASHLLLDTQVCDRIGFQQLSETGLVADKLLMQRGGQRIELVNADFAFLPDLLTFLLCLAG